MNITGWRFYVKPFNDDGTYQSSWIDCSEDMLFDGMGAISQQLDNTQFNIGIYRNSAISVKLNNKRGKYSDVTLSTSIFRLKRSNSLCKFTYQPEYFGSNLGDAILGDAYLSVETDIFTGLLSDATFTTDAKTLQAPFQVLGLESIFENVAIPTITNGQLLSAALYACLNQTAITNLLTVSAGNINLGSDVTIDDVTSLTTDASKTVKDAVDEILKISNSVLYISGTTLYVTPRTASVATKATFYGQASMIAPENIIDIQGIRTGIARVFNNLTWNGSAAIKTDTASTAKYGVINIQFDSKLITNVTRQNSLLASLLAEFSLPQIEFDLITPITYATLALLPLDRVNIDYPPVFLQGADPLPICGLAVCGTAILPNCLWTFTISTSTNLKILGRKFDLKKGEITFTLRGIPSGS